MAFSIVNSGRLATKDLIQRYRPALEYLLIGLLALLLLFKGIVPGWQTLNTDFPNYYVVARLVRAHYCLDRIYDWIWLQRMADHMGISHQFVGFLSLTPFSALTMLPLSWLSPIEAKRVWILFNVACLAVSVSLLSRRSEIRLRTAWLISLCAAIPLRTELVTGQMHMLVLLLFVFAYVSHLHEQQALSGLFIGLAAALKVYPILFCLYFVAKQRLKALAVAIVVTGCSVVASYFVFGPVAMTAYLAQQLPRSLQGESMNPFLPSATSSAAMFHRLFIFEPELNPHPLRPSPMLYVILYPLWQALLAGLVLARMRLRFRSDDRETLDWCLFTILLLFLSSAPASYHFVVLISAAIPCAAVLLKSGRWKAAALLVLYIAACNARTLTTARSNITLFTPLLYLKLWAGIVLLAFMAAMIPFEPLDACRSHMRFTGSYGTRVVVLSLLAWTVGSLNSWRHLMRGNDDDTQRLVLNNHSYLMNHPLYRDANIYYIGMQEGGGYRLIGDKPMPGKVNGLEHDELSYAIDPLDHSVWIEIASYEGSYITRILGAAACKIEDAENPAISDDDSLLAFIREDHGRGTLWLADLRGCKELGKPADQRVVTSSAYDVRTVSAGRNGNFIFSAINRGNENLFSITADGSIQPLIAENTALESPSISPRGDKMVAAKLVHDRWQLVSIDLASKHEHQFTSADCNVTTPSWKDENTIIYATDCERGLGLSALAWRSDGR